MKLLLLSIALLGVRAAAAEPPAMRLPFWPRSQWRFEGHGLHTGWADRRDLFVLHHPWEVSQAGAAGTLSRPVRVPDGWPGRVRLHVYLTDDYDGRYPRLPPGSWLGQISLPGHRFKQILVDDEVVWEEDVADVEGRGAPSRFSVLLPERVRAGRRLRLAFRLLDRVGSGERLPDDFRHIGETDGLQETDPWKFMTHLYIGDVVLTPEAVEQVETGEPPSARRTRSLHERRWPPPPFGGKVEFPAALRWEGEPAPGMACALRCGIPLPAGRVRDPRQVVLRARDRRRLPLQAAPMNRWPDGSLRWVEIDAIARGEDAGPRGELWLDLEEAPRPAAAPESPVSVRPAGEHAYDLSTGALHLVVGGEGRLIQRMERGAAFLTDLTGELEIDGRVFRPVVEASRVLAPGPVRAEIELSGRLLAAEPQTAPIGPFVFRLSAFAGQPCVRMTWRVFNDRPETLQVARFELTGASSIRGETTFAWGPAGEAAGRSLRLQQLREDRFQATDEAGAVLDSGRIAAGWLSAAGQSGSLLALVRHFQEQFPKALEMGEGRLRIALFEASADGDAVDPPPAPHSQLRHYQPTEGEAKRHEVWLGLWDRRLEAEEMRQTALVCARPPRLFDPDYFCASGGLGHAAPHDGERFAPLDAFMRETYGDIAAERFYRSGLRHWGDQIYNAENDWWCNGYYDRQQGFASEYLMSGDPRWFDRLEATVRHIIDIDVCHASRAHPEWVGSIHSYNGANHTAAGPWPAMQRTRGTLAYWRYTGDLDARQAALGVAESILRSGWGMGAGSVRDHGGVLYGLMAAYDETLDDRYLQGARRLAHDALQRIDPRRGLYSEIHGNVSYRGNVPWMVAQLIEPLYAYYRASGEVEAAVAVVGLAESILTENTTRGAWGDVYGYSHNPHFNKTSGYHILIAPAVLYAYELTGDDWFLRHARAMWAQMVREKSYNAINNCYWNAPTLLHYLQRWGE